MKHTSVVVFAIGLAQLTHAQIVTSPSENGWATASTTSYDWRYVRSGGGRGSHNYHWSPISDQSTSTSVVMPLNGTTGTQTSTGTFFSPAYSASCSGASSFSNSATQAVFDLSMRATSRFSPSLGTLGGASVKNDVLNEFFFTLPNDANVSVSITASPYAIVGFKNLTNGDVYFWGTGGNSFADTLPGGCNYELFVHLVEGASKDAYAGTSSNVGSVISLVDGQLTVTAATGGN